MLQEKTVLIVDDDDTLRDMYEHRLRAEGALVTYAPNGHEALLMVNENKPGLILLDIMMPEINGLDVLAKLKADEITARIPVVVLSALSDSDKQVKCKELGALGYYVKSDILPGELVEELNRLLTQNHQTIGY